MNKNTIAIMILIFACLAAFGRIGANGFICLDDHDYITENQHIQSDIAIQNIKWMLTARVAGNWHPLTLFSHGLDWKLFGPNPCGHHLVSLFLHITAVIFLFLFLYKTTNDFWPSVFTAAFFALHPLRVESVAWAAERKDVLSMFLGMLTLYVYAFYAERRKPAIYILCLFLFILTLMAKPMMVTLPFLLLLLDYWPLGRWRNAATFLIKERALSCGPLFLEKIPFIICSFIVCFLTLWAQTSAGYVASIDLIPLHIRFANAIVSYVSYLGKIIWPTNLAVYYPYDYHLSSWETAFSSVLLVFISLIVFSGMKKRPFLFTGWLWYLGTLIPVIGLVKVGGQAIADRYTYFPSIGITVGVTWGLPMLVRNKSWRKIIFFPAGIFLLVVLGVLTWRQCGYWKSSITIFSHTLQVTDNNCMAHSYLGYALTDDARFEEAIDQYNKAIALCPGADHYHRRGNAYSLIGRDHAAIKDFTEAIRLEPDSVGAYYNRGTSFSKTGQYEKAIKDYNKAISLKKDYTDAYNNRGIAYTKLGKYQLAAEDFGHAICLDQGNVIAYGNRAAVYDMLGCYKLAEEDHKKASALRRTAEAAPEAGK